MKRVKKFLQMSYKVLHFAIIIIIKLELRKNEWGKAACIANLRDGSNFGGRQWHGLVNRFLSEDSPFPPRTLQTKFGNPKNGTKAG